MEIEKCLCVCVGLHATACPESKCVFWLPGNKWCMCKWGKVLLLYLVMKNPSRLRCRLTLSRRLEALLLLDAALCADVSGLYNNRLPDYASCFCCMWAVSRFRSHRLRTLPKAYKSQGLANKQRSIKHSSVHVEIRNTLSDSVFDGCHDTDMAQPTSASGVRCSVRLNLTAGIH